MDFIKTKSIAVQLKMTISFFLLLGFLSISIFVAKYSSEVALNRSVLAEQARIQVLAKTVSSQFYIYVDKIKSLEGAFEFSYLKGLSFTNKKVRMGEYDVFDLQINGISLLHDFSVSDQFQRDTGIQSTLFVRSGKDFLRISTTLVKENGERAIGTLLNHDNIAYQSLLDGKESYAKQTLFNHNYLIYYKPVFYQGEVRAVIALFVSLDKASLAIFDNLDHILWGKTGTSFVISNSGTNFGAYIYHPSYTKKENIQNYLDIHGEAPLLKSFKQVQAPLYFTITEKGKKVQKYLVYADVPGWNWRLFAGGSVQELTKQSRDLLLSIALISLLSALVTLFILNIYIERITQQLTKISKYMVQLGRGETRMTVEKTPLQSKNEMHQLIKGVSVVALQLNELVGKMRGDK